MTQTPDTGAEIDAEAPEPDSVTAGSGDLDVAPQDVAADEHPFTAEDYAELAAEAESDGEPEPSLLDGLDPKLANHIQKLRRESADKRVALAEADERLQAAGAEVAALQDWKEQRLHRDVEHLAAGHKMIDGAEIWHITSLPELLDEHGDIDEEAVAEVIEAKVPAHWRVQVKFSGRSGFHSGSTGRAEHRPASWAQALARPQE
jgi:hypothetical protein